MNDTALLEQKPFIDSFLNQSARPLSAFAFVSIFAWCDFFDFELKTIDEALCIFVRNQDGVFLYLPPLGKTFSSDTIISVFKHMAPDGKPKGINRIENIPQNLLPSFKEGSYNQYTKPAEYVYRKVDLIELKGNAYKSQRHDCNCFLGHQALCSFEPYKDEDFNSCLKLYERWAEGRARTHTDVIYQSMLQENARVHARLLKFHQALGLVARVLKLDGKIIGYTFGFELDEATFVVYAEIADLSITGTAAYMFREFCADGQLEKFSRINTMDDFAMPNVARAKQSYHPSELLNSYNVTLKI